jgi:hypothetical protein
LTGKHDVSFKVCYNKDKTCEAGKQIGIREANNEIIALIDSDNILDGKKWLKKMVEPFNDPEITGSEPLYFTYRKDDSFITRYCALLGANDPLCYYLGNYDRYSKLSERWTGLDVSTKDKGNYIVAELDKKNIPTIGANGFLFRKSACEISMNSKYFFDIDEVYKMIKRGHKEFAKVKTSIIHLYASSIKVFIKKQKRRIVDYTYYKKRNVRKYPWSVNKLKLIKFITFSIIPIIPLVDAIKGYNKFKDIQVQFHKFMPHAEKRRSKIQKELKRIHYLTYQYDFVWENWQRKG